MHGILAQEGFTPHGCKATTLVMLSRYGASPDDRLILGHHQVNKGALEVYARDLRSAPLRVLEHMLRDIRHGRFSPEVTRSGLFTPVPTHMGFGATSDVVPTPTSLLDDTMESATSEDESLPSLAVAEAPLFEGPTLHA